MLGEGVWVTHPYVNGLSVVLGVKHEGLRQRLLVEQLDELGALEGHLRELAAELVLDRLLHPAEPDPLRVVDEHPEQDQTQVVHVLDLFALGRGAIAVSGRQLAEHGLDRLQHLPVVHDEPSDLDRELDDVADLPEGARREEGQVPLHQLPSHAVAASRKGVLAVEEPGEVLPHRFLVGVVRGVDVHPTLEPGRLGDKEDGRLVPAL
mmetsp:Transcript_100105/g.298763  ORF Transcript_100105/g.298763 Transcript_100105/m.298763 type:complete len:207 (-) Transcript_100105:141-761(-)